MAALASSGIPCQSKLFAEIINSRSNVLFCRKKKKRKKNINFWLCALRKNGFRKKKSQIFFLPLPPFAEYHNCGTDVVFAPLVRLKHPKHLLVGACLCYGLQSQNSTDPHLYACVGLDCRIGLQSHSPNDQHLYACVGLDCNPRVQGTPGPSQKWVLQKKMQT